jgi:hypothetical protein
LKPEFAAYQFNFSRLSDWANYGRVSHDRCQEISHESHRAVPAIVQFNIRQPEGSDCDAYRDDVTGRTITSLIGK